MSIYIDRPINGGGAPSIGISGSETVVVSRASQHFALPSGDGGQDTAVLVHLGGFPILLALGSDPSVSAPPETATHILNAGAYVAIALTDANFFAAQAMGGGIGVLCVAVGTLQPQNTMEQAEATYQTDNPPGSRWYKSSPPFDEPAA
jgi:hypothetical protein